MATVKPATKLPATKPTTAPVKAAPAKTAAPIKAAPAPVQQGNRAKKSFGETRGRGNNGIYLTPIDDYNAASYSIRINKLQKILRSESEGQIPCESSIIEFEVLTSNNDKCPPGFMASIVFTDRHGDQMYYENVKGFLCALLNRDPETIDIPQWDAAMRNAEQGGQSENFIGYIVDVIAKNKLREKSGKPPITNYLFTPNSDQYEEGSAPFLFESLGEEMEG